MQWDTTGLDNVGKSNKTNLEWECGVTQALITVG